MEKLCTLYSVVTMETPEVVAKGGRKKVEATLLCTEYSLLLLLVESNTLSLTGFYQNLNFPENTLQAHSSLWQHRDLMRWSRPK